MSAVNCINAEQPAREEGFDALGGLMISNARTGTVVHVWRARTYPRIRILPRVPCLRTGREFQPVFWIKTESIKQRETEREKERERES